MSYVPLTADEVAAGKPVTTNKMSKIKDNFTDHEDRIELLEAGSAVDYPPIMLSIFGKYKNLNLTDDVLRTTINFNLTITGIRLLIQTAGSSGSTTVDVEYKRGGGSWTSVLTTKPSVAYTAGNNSISSNAVLDVNEIDLEAGDLIRLNIDSVQGGNPEGFLVRIDYMRS